MRRHALPARRQRVEQGFNTAGEGRLRDEAEREAGERDTELRGGDRPCKVGQSALDGPGTLDALGGQLFDARPPDGNERELGGDEQPVERNQCRDGQQQRHVPAPMATPSCVGEHGRILSF